jgi:glycosyltransferase involved in cell wall biosynthesis
VLVGEGPQQPLLEEKIRALGIADAVRFAGYVPQNETAAWYRTADVFALSSDFDNSPNVVLEAMAAGLPVVATDVGGLREYVAEPRNGRLTPKGDARAFAHALASYVDDAASARATGEHNRADAVSRFSWAASAARMRDVYVEIVDRFRAGTAAPQVKAS